MATIASDMVSQIAEIVVPLAKEEFTLYSGMKDELRRLEERMVTIRAVLEDAERRAIRDRLVRVWLANLNDVLYDADDILDLYRTGVQQIARLSSDGSVPFYSSMSFYFSSMLLQYQTGSRIRSINMKLDGITKDQSAFGFIAAAVSAAPALALYDGGSSSGINHRQTGPLLEPDIVGMQIEDDTRYLVSLLMTKYCAPAAPATAHPTSVLAIIGMGGIGKTTLAQKVYNHPTIRDNFRRMWVCVSQDYSGINILQEVIRCAGGNHSRAQSFSELELLLSEVIEQKKFLLILDDVWNAQVWEDLLRRPLLNATAGSKILITTRDENVAKLMKAVHLHSVQLLPVEDGWSLLCKKVLQGGGDGGLEGVKDIGVQIVNKCSGLPLAIKTIAGVLIVKVRTRQEWERVLNNPAWSLTDLPDGVMRALYLSYLDLPCHLKQCFIYCSLFPEDARILRNKLVSSWIAHGFVGGGDMIKMEEVAERYYKELIRRSLIQPDPKFYNYTDWRMHDLLRSLAQFLAGDEIFSGDMEGLNVKVSDSTKLRHLFLVDNNLNSIPDILKDRTSLRTLHLESNSLVDVPLDLFKKLRQLRILEVKCKNVTRLPEFVQNLVHLRTLNLSFSSITELPETIGNLSNLHYLILEDCPNLHKLPKGVTELYNLTFLDILGTPISGLPEGIGRLQRLWYMHGFVTNESFDDKIGTRAQSHQDGWCCIEELRCLSQLRALSITKIEIAMFASKARGFLLKDKQHLCRLHMYCAPSRADRQPYSDEEVKRIQEIFEEELHPPNSIQQLRLKRFFGLQFPSWMTSRISEVLFNLRSLILFECQLCKQLPQLGQLPNLEYLRIKDAAAVETVGPEFFGFGGRWAQPSYYVPFAKLEILMLEDFPNWLDWLWGSKPEDAVMAMPRLQKLHLDSCPKLRSLTNLHTLVIEGANDPVSHSILPALQNLTVESCPTLRVMEDLNSLRFLKFKDIEMQSLPEWLMPREGEQQPFPALEKLKIIVGGVHILQRCLKDGPDWSKIQHFSSVHIEVDGKPEFLSYTKDPFSYNINMGVNNDNSDDGSDVGHHKKKKLKI